MLEGGKELRGADGVVARRYEAARDGCEPCLTVVVPFALLEFQGSAVWQLLEIMELGGVIRHRDAMRFSEFRLCAAVVLAAGASSGQQVSQEGQEPPPHWSRTGVLGSGPVTGPFKQLNISLDLLAAVGGSSERDPQILELQGGEHDPRKRGFTLQQAELQLNGEVDEWFTAQGVLVMFLEPGSGETVVELEEAFLQSTNLPHRLEARVGHYFTEFGRINPLHPHAWDWQDQPVILSRVFGPEGMRAPGARVAWLAPTHQYLEFFLSGQNANGGTMSSFLANEEAYAERAVGGRFYANGEQGARSGGDVAWSGRVATTFALSEQAALGLGASAAFGPNATGGDSDTLISGADFAYQWRPADSQGVSSFVRIQGEYIWREFETAQQIDTAAPGNPVLPADTLQDHGGYLYGLVGWDNGFACGVRCDYATGSAQSYVGDGAFSRTSDASRANRLRISPLLQYQMSPTSRLRLQYNYDDAGHLQGSAHSVWLGFEFLLGAQPPSRTGRDGLSGCSCR